MGTPLGEGLKAPASLAVRVAFLVSSHLVSWDDWETDPIPDPTATVLAPNYTLVRLSARSWSPAGVLASWRCYHRGPQTGQLTGQKFILCVLKAKRPQSKCRQGQEALAALGQTVLPSSSSWRWQRSAFLGSWLDGSQLPLHSAFASVCLFPPAASLLAGTVMAFRTHLVIQIFSSSQNVRFITSARTLSPSGGTFTSPRVRTRYLGWPFFHLLHQAPLTTAEALTLSCSTPCQSGPLPPGKAHGPSWSLQGLSWDG